MRGRGGQTARLTQLSLLTALALVISLLESALPPLTSVPGIKLGLANIVTLSVFYLYRRRDALLVLLARVILASLVAGRMISLPYSLCGGLLCFAVCALLLPLFPLKQLWLLSMIGAVFHNIGQICVAVLLTGTPALFWYLPFLLIAGLLSGFFTGHAAGQLLAHIRRLNGRGG